VVQKASDTQAVIYVTKPVANQLHFNR